MSKEQTKDALDKKNKENNNSNISNIIKNKDDDINNSDSKSSPSVPNYILLNEESSINRKSEENPESKEIMEIGILANLTSCDNTDTKKSECFSTNFDKKEVKNISNLDLNSKNKKKLFIKDKNEIKEVSEEEKNENSFKNNEKKSNSSCCENQPNIIEIKSYKNQNNNNILSEKQNIEKPYNISNVRNKNQNGEQKLKDIKHNNPNSKLENSKKNKKDFFDGKKNSICPYDKRDIAIKGNYEKIREVYENQIKKQLNNVFQIEEYEQFIDDYFKDYIYNEIHSIENPPVPSSDKGNFEEIKNLYNQSDEQTYDNPFYKEADEFYDTILNNENIYDDNNQNFERVSQNIIVLNIDNYENVEHLNNFCSLDKGNLEEIEDCLNNRFNVNLIFENDFILEYEKFCEKESSI